MSVLDSLLAIKPDDVQALVGMEQCGSMKEILENHFHITTKHWK